MIQKSAKYHQEIVSLFYFKILYQNKNPKSNKTQKRSHKNETAIKNILYNPTQITLHFQLSQLKILTNISTCNFRVVEFAVDKIHSRVLRNKLNRFYATVFRIVDLAFNFLPDIPYSSLDFTNPSFTEIHYWIKQISFESLFLYINRNIYEDFKT